MRATSINVEVRILSSPILLLPLCMNINMASKQQSVALGCKSELKIQEDYLNHERIHQFDLLLNQ